MANAVSVTAEKEYNALFDDISRLYEEARRSQVRFAWEAGRRIVEVEQKGALKAEYGSGLIARLSEDLTEKYGSGFSLTNLKDMRMFYLLTKKSRPVGQLPWSSHMRLLRVKDSKARRTLERRAVRENLTREELTDAIKAATGENGKPLPLLVRPTDLRLGMVKLVDPADPTVLDLGFYFRLAVTSKEAAAVTITEAPSFTYAADLIRVVDGDTVDVNIHLGFGAFCKERLRLRGVNTPELGTPEGERAKKFVEKTLPVGSCVVIKSTKCKTDNYGRFVADLFYGGKTGESIVQGGTYLNQELLDKKFAERMKE